MQFSGKLVIVGILLLALAAAATSWWFRYSATHQAAEFYGEYTRLIRDAPIVELLRFEPATQGGIAVDQSGKNELDRFLEAPTNRRDISRAPGLTHLRAALLEDRSYIWPSRPQTPSDHWQWILVFRDSTSSTGGILIFSPDWQDVAVHGMRVHRERRVVFERIGVSAGRVVSCRPIAAGLARMLEELAQESTAQR